MIEVINNDNKLSFELSEQASSCALFQFLRNTSTFDGQRVCNHELLKKLCAIGYLTVGYKNNRSSRAIVCEGEARTGKSLFASLFKRIAEVFVVDGRVLKKSRDPFSNMRKSTRIVLIEDLQQDYNIEYLFPNITGDWIIAKHNEYDVKLGFSESPKIIITTQASLVGKGASFTDRFLILKFSNHYHKAHNVVDDFGKIFFEEWDISDWKNTWDLIADCIHLYHQFGFVDNPDNAIP